MQEVCVAAWQCSRAAVLEVMACPQEKDLTLRSDLSSCGRTEGDVSIHNHIKSVSHLYLGVTYLEAMMIMMTAVIRTNTRRSWRWTVVRGVVVREKCFSAALDTPSRRSPPMDVCWYKFRLFCSVSRHLGWPLIDTGLLSESSAGWCGFRSQPLNWSKRPYVAQEIGQRRWLFIWLMVRKQDYCVCLSINDFIKATCLIR